MTMDRSAGDLHLIRLVRQHPYLYDTGSDNYKNVKLKDNTWKKIALSLGLTVDVSKTRWKSLRTSYLRHCKLLACRKKESTKCRKWPLADELAFLNPYLVPTDYIAGTNGGGVPEEPEPLSEDAWARVYDDGGASATNGGSTTTSAASGTGAKPPPPLPMETVVDDEIEEIIEHHPAEELHEVFAFDGGEVPPDSVASDGSFSSVATSMAPEPDSAVSRSERRPSRHSGAVAAIAIGTSSPDEDPRRRDTTRDFFLYLAETVKTFPPYMQAVVKGKCFEAVNSAELSVMSPVTQRGGNATPVHR